MFLVFISINQVYRTARPVLTFENNRTLSHGVEYMLVKPRHSLLYFPAVEHVRCEINSAIKEKLPSFIVFDCRNIQELDYTAAKGIGSFKKELSEKHVSLILLGPSDEVKLVLKGSLKGNSVQQVDNELELNILLHEQTESSKIELMEVVAPLLEQKDAEGDITTAVAKPESLRRE